ncbi:hypothetical protein cypCar_00033463 [Cyprinus carpio]|nr:hypothetical protein cypCar_00033463 [Cyprinus carpio]
MNQSDPSNPAPEGPDPASPPAGLQPENQSPPVQPVMNISATVNAVPQLIQPYKGHPVQIYPPNAIPQTAGPGQVPPGAVLQPQNQPLPVQTLMNQSPNPMPQPGQQLSTYPVGGYVVPGQVPPLAGLQLGNHPPQVQTVILSTPAPAVPPLVLLYGVPPGLEYLTQIDQILVHQKMECIEMFTGFETNNKYEIKNSIGQEIYHAKEKSNCFMRNIFGPARGFRMEIKDHMGQEVIHMERPMRCFMQEIEVQAPPGITIGYVKQEWSCLFPKFSILGPNNEVLLKIRGPFLPFKCCGDINFEVKGMIGKDSIGRITKQRSGFIKKCISDATNFCIQFPMDMDVNMKAVLLGACLLIDIMFFEKGGNLFLKLLKGF